ncbi:helix-turn-helix transcriptional regulator [Clostridium sp. BL-8]|uniref:helix-turn-helix domain-containing protein n=1 Tax=Clostridium sp. BL-8 TaxID=349938 RepID=UPI00098CB34B|nr:helix-turn-helix transcriptional regulator [Clostridium sp. BL-8]OOM73139.1 helix-turn-helix domain protein [Clostridium sp. BL-8]
MFDNEIVAPGEKLKRIRKILHITQEELSKDICSKNNISLIENGKQKISASLANAISKKFNEAAKEKRGIDIKLINADFLMKDENEQANDIFNDVINELKKTETIDLFESKFLKAEEMIKNYNIAEKNKIELYRLAANFYYYKHKYSTSDIMCDVGLKICIDIKNIEEEANLYVYKSRNNIFSDKYLQALQQLEFAEELNNSISNDELSIMIFYQKALAYKKLGQYDTALKYFKKLKKFEIKNQKMLLKIKMVYANCLNEENQFEEAEKEYFEILDVNDRDFIGLAYRNLSELYFNKKRYKDAAKYIKDALIYLIDNEKKSYLNDALYIAAKTLKYINEDVEVYLLQALEICERSDREKSKLIQNIINELILLYMEREDEKNITLIVEKAKELNIDCNLIYAELIKYYRYRNDEKSIYFNNKLINKLK